MARSRNMRNVCCAETLDGMVEACTYWPRYQYILLNAQSGEPLESNVVSMADHRRLHFAARHFWVNLQYRNKEG